VLCKKYDPMPRTLTGQQQAALDAPDEFTLSIITINQNNAAQIPRTIKSLERVREDPEVECIFIDGASTDESVVIARNFYKPENLVTEPDSGIYDAQNKGLYKSRGKYVLWINSGDELLGDFDVKALKDSLMASQSDIYCCGLVFWDIEADSLKRLVIPTNIDMPSGEFFPHLSTIFKRKKAIIYGGYREKYKIAADRDLYLRMRLSGCKVTLSEYVITKFYSGGLSSSKKLFYENLRIDYDNKLISYFTYLYRIANHIKWLYKQSILRMFSGKHK